MRKTKKPPKPNEVYELPTKIVVRDQVVILGMDPGSRNFGIALVGTSNGKIKVYANAVLMRPVNDLVSFGMSSDAFMKEIKAWIDLGNPKGVVAERFQTRGNGGPLIEQVSAMLGLIRGRYPKLPMKLTIASAWKNKFNRRFNMDLKEIYPTTRVQPHQLDATLIGIFGLEAGLGKELSFTIEDVIKQCEATSLVKLKNLKIQK